ncbi:MAG: hypothetical protein JO073_11590 [Actinobacteria bacterium]|nr:hypothetical protein [Actinomycetota bacterium]
MRSVWQKHLGLWLVFAAGVVFGVVGVYLVVRDESMAIGIVEAVGGLGLVAWVLFHPARVADGARVGR